MQPLIGILVLFALCAASARSYARDHRGGGYARGRRPLAGSLPSFRRVYCWLRWTTPIAGAGALFGDSAWWLAWSVPTPLFCVGIVSAVGGFAMFVLSRTTLGQAYAPCFDARRPDRLVTKGVYSCIRHPIYTANVTTMSGLTLLTGSGWLLLNTLVLAVSCWTAARREEGDLLCEHPGYREHCERTGRFLPRLRPGDFGNRPFCGSMPVPPGDARRGVGQ